MKRILPQLFQAGCLVFCSLFVSVSVSAQIAADGTTSTEVTTNDSNNFNINAGDRVGSNLFHSFSDFSVPTGGSASFNNALDVDNIINRVTGGNISNIDGLLRANGSANLFLINPAGIIFGAGARLNIGGSFLGSTADSILFPEGEFSAVDLDNPPLLTINAPIGLGIRNNPGDIINQSVSNNGAGLQVPLGESITLVGGDINLAGGNIFAPGGRVELGGLSAAGEISINPNGELSFPSDIERADINLTNQAAVDVRADGGGFINFNARNLTLSEQSQLLTGIAENISSSDAQPGDITINATESVRLIGTTLNLNELIPLTAIVISGTVTTSNLEILTGIISEGDITINTPNLLLQNGAFLGSTVFANNNTSIEGAGDIIISNSQQVEVTGSFITTLANRNTETRAGDITINTERLLVKEGAAIASATFGNGDGGEININASESIEVTTTLADAIIPTIITSNSIFGQGTAGDINIDTGNLIVREGGAISSDSGGEIFIGENQDIGNVFAPSDLQIGSEGNIFLIQGGSAGNLEIKADSIEITGRSIGNQFSSALTSESTTSASAGNINIDTNELIISDSAEVRVGSTLTGEGGNIDIQTNSLTLENEALISAQANESADGGNIDIDAEFIIAFPNQNNDIVANAEQGTGGSINIITEGIFGLEERSSEPANNTNDIDASSDFGLDGTVSINTPDVGTLQELIEVPGVVEPEILGANACSGGESGASSLAIAGKGGTPPIPTEPLTADALIIDGINVTTDIKTDEEIREEEEKNKSRSDFVPTEAEENETKERKFVTMIKREEPFKLDEIVPARGMIIKENGDVILTAYPTRNSVSRIPVNLASCPG